MNKEQVSEKKQIAKHIKARIERGEPKQLILEELSHLYKDKVTISKQLESTPSEAMKSKYRNFNFLLAALLLIALVLDIILLIGELKLTGVDWTAGRYVINANYTISIALDMIFVIGVLMFRIEIYSWIASRAMVTLLAILIALAYYGYTIPVLMYVSLGLIVICFFLGLYLGVKLCPGRIPKIIEVDIDGVEKIKKTIYVFPD